MADCNCKDLEKHADHFHAMLGEYERQAKGGGLSVQTTMLKNLIEGKVKAATTPQAKAELKKQLIETFAYGLKVLERL